MLKPKQSKETSLLLIIIQAKGTCESPVCKDPIASLVKVYIPGELIIEQLVNAKDADINNKINNKNIRIGTSIGTTLTNL